MLITPRLYSHYRQAQNSLLSARQRRVADGDDSASINWSTLPPETAHYVKTMLLVHQTGSVRVGEVVRYNLIYTPARDRVRPIPSYLHVRIRNTSAIALRAAYLHGPYTLYAACYPAAFNPNAKNDVENHGEPQFEPTLKAGGSWTAKIKIPDSLRLMCDEPSSDGSEPEGCTWIIECTSQVLFSTTAHVHYEVIVGRDEKSIEVGFAGLTGSVNSVPGRLVDHQEDHSASSERLGPARGVFSNAIRVVVEDTATLWDKPRVPGLERFGLHEFKSQPSRVEKLPNEVDAEQEGTKSNAPDASHTKKKRLHLVVITHGLHSNLGADMLYMKESIDAAAKQARIDARSRRKAQPSTHPHSTEDDEEGGPTVSASDKPATSTAPLSGGQEDLDDDLEDDEEEVIVHGFSGNVVRTEKGIQYLGKRLAKYVLLMTYPDQPFLPVKKSLKKTLSRTFTGKDKHEKEEGHETHHHSSVRYGGGAFPHLDRPYKITSISFIGHSLGGLTQTYAIAYIHKHSPEFFRLVQPINFIALASPLLGLSNENPLYVKFALDFGLVGRTGQDLGLTWRAPTIARNGWAGMIAGIGTEKQRAPKRVDPGTKPLLRLLPSGPAHQALKMFRNRTVYSNVVNDGIVPLRTSCLLFLDWRGLGRVEKARRENGLIGTMAGWGWAELTGTNSTEHRSQWPWRKADPSDIPSSDNSDADEDEVSQGHDGDAVPQPSEDATSADYGAASGAGRALGESGSKDRRSRSTPSPTEKRRSGSTRDEANSPLAGFMSFFGSAGGRKSKSDGTGRKEVKAIRRAQTLKLDAMEESPSSSHAPSPEPGSHPAPTEQRKTSVDNGGEVFAPPKTSVFEAAGDLLNPPLPPLEFITDPQNRPRTIFHDRVYHPGDIPPPPTRRKSTFLKRRNGSTSTSASRRASEALHEDLAAEGAPSSSNAATLEEVGSMPVEEKIARAYHRDLSWRKVLVRLSPDAHNNIVVRRMFANAYGWPVVKHLVDTHFADTYAALTADRKEENVERARPMHESATAVGDEVENQRRRKDGDATGDDERQVSEEEEADAVGELKAKDETVGSLASSQSWSKMKLSAADRQDSVSSSAWTDRLFDGGSDDDSSGDDYSGIQGAGHASSDNAKTSPSQRDAKVVMKPSADVFPNESRTLPVSSGRTKGKDREMH